MAAGYFRREELTAQRFIADPFEPAAGARLYRTGDRGRWRDDGMLDCLGRGDHQVKIRGYRIELGEIESQLLLLPGIAQCVVTMREDAGGDVMLVAYVVAAQQSVVDAPLLRGMLKARLPEYMIPRHIVELTKLPLLPNGKIDRNALPAPARATIAAVVTDGLEQRVREAMLEVLGLAGMSSSDNFFELGGHSLLAAKLSAKLAEITGQRPGLRMIFDAPTPRALAAALRASLRDPKSGSPQVIPVRPDQSIAPLSQMQQRVWFLENLTPDTVVHSIPTGHRLTGPLDVPAFDRAFNLLIARHSVLRTTIERSPDGGRQRILPTLHFSLSPVDDLSDLPSEQRKEALARRIAALVEQPYDLENGPLFTARLFRLSTTEHVLLFQAHHLIWDAHSFDILYMDVAELYTAVLENRPPRLPEISVSYGDFAAWHNEWMTGPELLRQVEYWRGKLTPLPPPIELPLDRERPDEMSGRGGSHQFNLSKDITQALRSQAQVGGRTLYVTLLAAYTLALHQESRQTDFVVGTPVRGREQAALEPLMGFFVNMLPMRMTIDRQLPLDAWLVKLHAMVVESFSFADVPFDHLVREVKAPRDGSRPPIHQVVFSYQDVRERPAKWGNVDHQRSPTPMLGAAQELSLWCVETKNHIEFVFTFAADIMDVDRIKAFGQRLESLLKEMLVHPSRTLGSFDAAEEPSTVAQKDMLAADPLTAASAERGALANEPTTTAELAIASVWQELLGVESVMRNDNFFDLGGHSMLAMRAVAQIEARTGVRINVRRLIFETLGQIASTPAKSVRSKSAEPVKDGGFLGRLASSLRFKDRK